MFERQNDPQALTYLKAHIYCERRDRLICMGILVLSLLFFVAGIFNRYMPLIFNNNSDKLLETRETVSQIVNILSGIFLISQIFINTVARHANRDSACLLSLYECYVYDMTPNKSMLVPYTQNDIEAFARRIKRNPERYVNYLFASPEQAAGSFAAFEKQYSVVNDQYRLMNYSYRFFLVLWIGFLALVLGLALSFDDKFIATMTNMLIPSLSIVNIIVRSVHTFTESNNRLRNAISTMDKKREGCKKSWTAHEQREFLLEAQKFSQDTIFMLRLLEFTVPHFLERQCKKYYSRPMHADIVKKATPEEEPGITNAASS